MPPTVNLLGLDLGKDRDPAALAALARYARAVPNDVPEWAYTVIGLKSFALGTPYQTQPERPDEHGLLEQVRAIATMPQFAGCTMAMDWTGVGSPVYDMFMAAKPQLPVWIRPIKIVSGAKVTVEGQGFHVPKQELVTCLEVLLQANRLTISPAPPGDAERRALLDRLADEFRHFVRKTTRAGNTKSGGEGSWHDDIVSAVATAAWIGEHTPCGWDGSLGMGNPIQQPPRGSFGREAKGVDPYREDGLSPRQAYGVDGAQGGVVDGTDIPSQW